MPAIKAKDTLYAAVGVADVALERARDLAGEVRSYAEKTREPRTFAKTTVTDLRKLVTSRSKELQKQLTKRQRGATRTYNQLAKRGQTLITRVKRSAPAKRAAEQTRTAQRQVKTAAKSVRKAASTTVEATVATAQKVG